MKKLLFLNLLFLFATNYSMKRDHKQQDLKSNTGDFQYVPNDILKKLIITSCKKQSHTRALFIHLSNLILLNKWFKNFIDDNSEVIYEKCLLPIEYAALLGQPDQFVFEKVLNKAQLYPTFLYCSNGKTEISLNCVMNKEVKELLTFSSNAVYSSIKNPKKHITCFMPVSTRHQQNPDGTYTLVASIRDETISLINEFTSKPCTLTNEQLEILKKTYNTNNIVNALKNLYSDFLITINAENFLHFLFDIENEIPLDLFKDLVHIRGNINAHDANGKTFIEKAGEKPMYKNLVPELLSLPELANYPSSSHALLFNT